MIWYGFELKTGASKYVSISCKYVHIQGLKDRKKILSIGEKKEK